MAGFGTIAPGMDDEDAMLAGLQPAAAAPDGVDWSRMNQPFGELKRRPEDEIAIKTRNPLTDITQGDIERGMNIAMATSGGGLATGVPKPTVGARQAFSSWVDALKGEPHAAGATAETPSVPPAAAGVEAAPGAPPDYVFGGYGSRAARVAKAQYAAEQAAGKYAALPGLPQGPYKVGDQLFIPGPIGKIKDIAEGYMRDRLQPSYHQTPVEFHPLDEEHSKAIAQAFEDMKHTPDDPATKNAYDAMIKETRDQYDYIRQNHPELQLVPNPPGVDPYAQTPRLAAKDVIENNRLHFFPTEQGYGTGEQGGIDMSTHPMMQESGRTLNGKPLLNNDLFRIVHDYFGHLKEGYGFRAAGEDNAWRSHAAMYSDLARPAMTSETRGQNSWVNFGPHAEANKGASGADTIYADQKVGLMPEWTMRDRGSPEPLVTYRGGPQPYSMVDMSKIGTGQGSQVRGQGMYSATDQPIATFYRHYTAAMQDPLMKKYKLDRAASDQLARDLGDNAGDHKPIVEDLQDHIENLKRQQNDPNSGVNLMSSDRQIKKSQAMIRYLNDPNRAQGHMYEVTSDRPSEHYLHWDEPFKNQSEYVKNIFQPLIEAQTPISQRARDQLLTNAKGKLAKLEAGPLPPVSKDLMRQRLQRDIDRYSQPVSFENTPGSTLYEGLAAHQALGRAPKDVGESHPIATQYLRAKGLAGIKYLAGKNFSLPPGVPVGSLNYVNFNPERILKRYAIPGVLGGGAAAGAMAGGEDGSQTPAP